MMKSIVEYMPKSILLQFGPEEESALQKLEDLASKGILPSNRSEVLRRALVSAVRLAEIDESLILQRATRRLSTVDWQSIISNDDESDALLSEAIQSYSIAYSIKVIKSGQLSVEPMTKIIERLQNIVVRVKGLQKVGRKMVSEEKDQAIRELVDDIGEVVATVKTLYS